MTLRRLLRFSSLMANVLALTNMLAFTVLLLAAVITAFGVLWTWVLGLAYPGVVDRFWTFAIAASFAASSLLISIAVFFAFVMKGKKKPCRLSVDCPPAVDSKPSTGG